MTKYRITNYGNTRKLPYEGQYYEIIKNSSIETSNKQLAEELGKFPFVDVVVVDQPVKQEMKVAAGNNIKIKRGKK